MVRTVQFNKPHTDSACVTAMALRASDQAPEPVAARHTKLLAKTMTLPSNSIRLKKGTLKRDQPPPPPKKKGRVWLVKDDGMIFFYGWDDKNDKKLLVI